MNAGLNRVSELPSAPPAPGRSLVRIDPLARGACSVAEAGIAAVCLLGAAFLAFGAHVAHGNFELDDWSWAADHAQHPGFFAFAEHLLSSSLSYGGTRPGEAIYFA